MHVCMYGACIYDAIFFGNGPTDERTDKAILGVGYVKYVKQGDPDVCMYDAYCLDPNTRGYDTHICMIHLSMILDPDT